VGAEDDGFVVKGVPEDVLELCVDLLLRQKGRSFR
jgi:hypothetical protein